jgi:hypothetical protein
MAARDNLHPETVAQVQEDQQFAMAEFMADQAETLLNIETGKHLVPTNEELRRETHAALKGGKCTLCNAEATDGHLASKGHHARCSVAARLSILAGRPAKGGARVLYSGAAPPFTQQTLREVWGENLDLLPRRALNRLRHTGVSIKMSARAPARVIPGGAIKGCGLGVVNFKHGDTKYSRSKLTRWEGVPEQWPDATPEPVSAPGSGGGASGRRSDRMTQQAFEGQTFWPVVYLDFEEDSEAGTLGLHWGLSEGAGGRWIVCIYQVLNDLPDAWWASFQEWFVGPQLTPPPPHPPLQNAGVWEDEPPPEPLPRIPPRRQAPYPSEAMEMID